RFLCGLRALLGVLLFATQLVRIAALGRRYRIGARVSFALVGGVCAALAMLGTLVRLTPDLQFHLHLSFVFFSLLAVVAVAGSPADPPVKLGTLLLWVAPALGFAAELKGRLALPGTPTLLQG